MTNFMQIYATASFALWIIAIVLQWFDDNKNGPNLFLLLTSINLWVVFAIQIARLTFER